MKNDPKPATAPFPAASIKSTAPATSPLPAPPVKSTAPATSPLPAVPVKSTASATSPFPAAPIKCTAPATSPLPAVPIKCTTPAVSSLPAAPIKCSLLRTAALFLLLITTIIFLEGCKTKQTITEKATVKTDSTAHWDLNDSLFKKETLLTTLQSDLQRFRDENIRLLNEASTHFISYDTTAPVNPQTGKPPIASESYTVNKSTLEQSKKEYETLLQIATLENATLTRQNRNLQLTVEKLTNENKQLTEKTTTPGLNLKPLLAGLVIKFFIFLIIYITLKKIISRSFLNL